MDLGHYNLCIEHLHVALCKIILWYYKIYPLQNFIGIKFSKFAHVSFQFIHTNIYSTVLAKRPLFCAYNTFLE